MPAPGTTTGAAGSPLRTTLTAGAALLAILGFALEGPDGIPGLLALGACFVALVLYLPASGRVLLVAMLGLTVLLAQAERGFNYFDPIPVALAVTAFLWTLMRGDRAAWIVGRPGWITIGALLAPLVALPTAVVSVASFLGVYKMHVLYALQFHALRRLVPWEKSQALLWLFPVLGTIGALQLFLKTQGLGALLFARMSFRNFYTRLAWGQSDFISAVLEFCICASVVLFLLERRVWARVALVAAIAVMFQAFLLLFSRAGVVGFGVFAVVMAIGLGGRRGWAALGIAAAVLGLGLLTPGGQTTAARFTDPHELGSFEFRFVIWGLGIVRFLDHPWTGIGLNQGRFQHDLLKDDPTNNFLLEVLTEQGVLGGWMMVLIVVAAYRLCLRAVPFGHESSPRAIRVALVATLSQMLVHASVEPTINGLPMAVLFIYFLAWLAIQDPRGRETRGTA